MRDLVIRAMTREDLPGVCAVDRLCFTGHWSEAVFAAELTSTVGHYRVAELSGEIVGFIGSHVIMGEAHITTFGVHPERRRRGLGERLLLDLIQRALWAGCRRITLEVRESNVAALRLYEKYGFSAVSRRKAYYPDNREDALVLWIEDTGRVEFRRNFEERLRALNGGAP